MEYIIKKIVLTNFKHFYEYQFYLNLREKLLFLWTLQLYKLKIGIKTDATHSND